MTSWTTSCQILRKPGQPSSFNLESNFIRGREYELSNQKNNAPHNKLDKKLGKTLFKNLNKNLDKDLDDK